MIKFKSNNSNKAFGISNHYMPNRGDFQTGTYIINGTEYTEWNAEFRNAVEKEIMWRKLRANV